MSKRLCSIEFIGNVGQDPEMRYTPQGKPITTFSVAVNQSKPDGQGGWTDETDWFRVSVWGQSGADGGQAEKVAEEIRKGNRVFVRGRFKSREYEGKDGGMRTSLDVTADTVIDLGRKPRSGDSEDGEFREPAAAAAGPSNGSRASSPSTSDLDDLPF